MTVTHRCSDAPEWVKRQRRISCKAAAGFCFTLAMLAHDCRISKNIKGIDPAGSDTERVADEKTWLAAHPLITEAEREIYRVTAGKLNDKSLGFQGANSVNPCA
jgi:hypothetical protein